MRVEVDTGVSESIINMETYQEIKCKSDNLMPVNNQLRAYSEEIIKFIGKLYGELVYNNHIFNVSFIVADTKGPNLLGRDILGLMKLKWGKLLDINNVREFVTTEEK